MDWTLGDPSAYELDEDKLELEADNVESPKWSTGPLLTLFVVSMMGIHFTCIAINYIICFYRFVMVWNQIFRMHRGDQQRASTISCISERTIQNSLVTSMYTTLWDESAKDLDAACPICLFNFDRTDLVSHGHTCHHIFHRECITAWLQEQQSCPCCRQDITQERESSKEYSTLYEYFKMSIAMAGLSHN